MVFNFFCVYNCRLKKWFLKHLCRNIFVKRISISNHVREKNQVVCRKLKWYILINCSFVKLLSTRYTNWLGYINDPFTNIFLVLNKIKRY